MRGKRWFEKKTKKKLIARVGIRGHIYYMNKKRQFLNSLWPFCMIKINLALKNLVILHFYRTKRTKFCYAMSIDFKGCKNIEPARSQKAEQTMQKRCKNTESACSQKKSKRCKKMTQFDGPTRAWFPFGTNNNFFSRSQW